MTQLLPLLERELKKHQSETTFTQLKKGDYFVYSGQVNRHVALITSGYLRTFHTNDKGDEITTEFSVPGQFCASYYSFFTEQPAFEYIEALTDCELHLVSYTLLQKMYHESFEMNMLGRKFIEQALVQNDLRSKKIKHLTAKEKYEWFVETYRAVYKHCKLQHIASFLDVSNETLSRVRRTLIS